MNPLVASLMSVVSMPFSARKRAPTMNPAPQCFYTHTGVSAFNTYPGGQYVPPSNPWTP